jgi:hypothetical protein
LEAIRCCVTAWRRAVIEHWFQDGADSREALSARLSALSDYNRGWDGADPFTEQVLAIPVGGLEPSLLLEAHWRGETAAAIAWALGLIPELPPPSQGTDAAILDRWYPVGESSPGVVRAMREARLRDRAILTAKLAEWRQHLASAEAERERAGPADREAAFAFSRAYERTRGLAWVLSDVSTIEDTPVDP